LISSQIFANVLSTSLFIY